MVSISIRCSTWQYNAIIAYEALCAASAAGYTCIDTAHSDRHQKGVGRAIRGCNTQSRGKLFVLTKSLGELDSSLNLSAQAERISS